MNSEESQSAYDELVNSYKCLDLLTTNETELCVGTGYLVNTHDLYKEAIAHSENTTRLNFALLHSRFLAGKLQVHQAVSTADACFLACSSHRSGQPYQRSICDLPAEIWSTIWFFIWRKSLTIHKYPQYQSKLFDHGKATSLSPKSKFRLRTDTIGSTVSIKDYLYDPELGVYWCWSEWVVTELFEAASDRGQVSYRLIRREAVSVHLISASDFDLHADPTQSTRIPCRL